MSKEKKESGAHGAKDNSSTATRRDSARNATQAARQSGPHATGKDVSSTVSRRDDHPGKAKEREQRQALIDDQRVSGFDTGTLGSESFPKHSTASGDVAAKEAQVKGNRPGISPKKK